MLQMYILFGPRLRTQLICCGKTGMFLVVLRLYLLWSTTSTLKDQQTAGL